MSFPTIGKAAPAFSLKNQFGETVSLSQFKGKKQVVLYFYPKASTPGCTTQACGIRDTHTEFDALDTVVLGVSPDNPAKLKKFDEKYQLNFSLLADEDHSIAEAYGVWGLKKFMGREFMGILRTTFVIDKQGKVRQVIDKVNTKTHDQDLLDILRAGM
ncbi:thioredoxin-dependent thiol peroxidase [Cellvibrio japonicus]|uniref:thioredoxin-dependent peroxiredoxin n=1 Tax=Cellvibrio japonicus (strain Ueda107) TaxID=498211 RepID=B3PET4_CELJU|nr:thioredoxin-dependent thiol peroxidase [Cellvibrio japonicus]ACE84168.1 Bcp [Cellvibrio japonicus Ueda107]QEI12183.1 thioredoxin-dependent thiol peroxidase [Cellvibrio japonicus]QEI15757.1 thioredoxin-dependent thiol peroxidase [Cellvibrio japonicus]QEI19335.1 thioredoxin-dependent thiol peroxidase [Cellvibrio japonicus]